MANGPESDGAVRVPCLHERAGKRQRFADDWGHVTLLATVTRGEARTKP